MCGYNTESRADISAEDLKSQFAKGVSDLQDIALLKVYTSGSFLDEKEVPPDVADSILVYCSNSGTRLLFESRPEFVRPDRLKNMLQKHDDLEIALGLESSNDRVLKYSINKGFTVDDYSAAARTIRETGIAVRTYVLLKPPFLTEAEAIADAKATIRFAAMASDAVSLNPVNIQKGTLVEKLWSNWSYRSPWLWSVLEVLRESSSTSAKLICEPTGGGKERGAHNCGKCDASILESLREFSLSQNYGKLRSTDCECRDLWESIVGTEGFVVGGAVDLQRFFRKHRA